MFLSLVDDPERPHGAAADVTNGKLYGWVYPVLHSWPDLKELRGYENATITGPFPPERIVMFSNGLVPLTGEEIRAETDKLGLSARERLNVARAYEEWSGEPLFTEKETAVLKAEVRLEQDDAVRIAKRESAKRQALQEAAQELTAAARETVPATTVRLPEQETPPPNKNAPQRRTFRKVGPA